MSKVARGFFWSAIDHLSVQVLQFILSIIIARLVSPDAFGVIVMTQVFMTFAQVFIDGGFKSALIQKTNRTESDFHTVFIFNMILAFLLYGIMFFIAPYIANFYNQPILKNITRVISLNLIFSSLSITQLVKIQASLNFKVQAKARVIAVFVSGCVGVMCAYKGLEVWALVIQSVLCTILTSALLMSFSRWRPQLIFSLEAFRELFSFGSKVLFSNLLTTFYMQFSNLIIGKFYTPTQLAYYNRGFTFATIPSVSIVEVMGRTIYPVFCELQNSREELIKSYRKYIRLVSFIVLPIMLTISCLSFPLIDFLLTEKWISTAPLLSIFCISFATYPIQYITGNLALSVGRSDLVAKLNILKQGIALVLLLITIPISVKAVAYSLLVSNILNAFIGMWCVKVVRSVTILDQINYFLPILIISIISSIIAYIVSLLFVGSFLKLLCASISAIICYISLLYVLRFEEMQIIRLFFKK